MAVLERDGFACVACGARGRLEVDHVSPVRTHPDGAYDPRNLQALCPTCHTDKTNAETGRCRPDPRRQAWKTLLRQPQPNPIEQQGDTNA